MRTSLVLFPALCFGALLSFLTPATSQAVLLEGEVESDGTLQALRATLDPSVASISINVNGLAAEAEREKCRGLIEIAGDDVAGIFQNATSTLTVSTTLSESRDASTLGLAWRNAIQDLQKPMGVEFSTEGIESFFPTARELRVDIADESFKGGQLPKAARAFLNSRFAAAIQDSFSMQIDTFNQQGVLRTESDSQAIVCYALLLKRATIKVSFLGRTLDFKRLTQILDNNCIRKLVEGLNDDFKSREVDGDWDQSFELFTFLMGVEIQRHEDDGKSVFRGRSAELCVLPEGADITESADAQAEWMKLLRIWYEQAQTTRKLYLDAASLKQLQGIGVRVDLIPTSVSYTHSFAFEG